MYRRALVASWAAQPGELQADECIEDIFAGGNGLGDAEKFEEVSKRKNLALRSSRYEQNKTRDRQTRRNQADKEISTHIVIDEDEYRENLSSWVLPSDKHA